MALRPGAKIPSGLFQFLKLSVRGVRQMAVEQQRSAAEHYRAMVEGSGANRLENTHRHVKTLRRMVGYQTGEFKPGNYSTNLTTAEMWALATHVTFLSKVRAMDDPEQLLDVTNRLVSIVERQ